MDISSSRLDNEGKVESLYMRIPNDDALTEQDCPQTGVDKEVEKPKESMMLCSEEESDDNEDNVLLSKMIDGDEKVEPPKKSMTFSSHEEVISYYKKYAKQVGFGVSRRMIKKTPDGHPRYMLLTCIRECSRVRNTSNAMKPNPTTNRTKCNARICATLWDDGTWFLSKVVVEHNHSLSPSKARFLRCYKNINDPAKRRHELNDRAGIRANKNFNSLVEMGEFENLPFGERECRNFINKARELRLGKGGGQALCDYFTRMRSQNDGFYYVMDMDDNGRLRNVFWADTRSRAAYEFFGDAITFDTTYLTNRYDIPFTPFVGVNHHGQSILFGAGLISNEDTDTFVWLFESWLKCMNNRAPSAIITDRTRAMKNAIVRVFPKTRHRYCLWHIMRKLPEKFGSHDHYNDIRSALNTCLYDSITVDEFEKNWKILIESYQLQDNPWLNRLYRERTFWVAAYMKDTCWAGMDTTQQSENMNGFLDSYVHSKTTIKEFLDLFDNALRKMVERETHSDFDCFNRTIPCVTVFPLEKLFQDVYTNAKFKEVQEQFGTCVSCNNSLLKSEGAISTYQVIETVVVPGNRMIDKIFGVFFNEDEFEVKCTCAMFELRGIICKHSISVLLTKKVTTLPSRYILDRWMKNIKRKYTLIKSSCDAFVGNSSSQRYDRMCKNCEELASLTSESVEYFMEVMKTVDMLKEKYRALRSVVPSQRYHNVSHAVASASCNEAIQSNDGLHLYGNNNGSNLGRSP
ncbi:protein FAR1-RELATED SEQUENCE 5-like isoform X2 [Corylus avellana]|uniref:protein FAR1-RELATED SEQUENCE 5-like isoform X2 n=1 Tax=Corylus avellana TaxID=13451 RepID=UPI00286A4FF1|nr:protein FAR1-RELATED SEQUENCE 5-like isoform X2 [Corylus avellana]